MTNQHHLRKNELREELVSVHALNPDVAHDAPARSTMFAGHFAQRPVILGSEPSLTQSIQSEWGKYTFGVRMPEEGSILFVLQRFPKSVTGASINTNGIPTDNYVFYRSHETGEIGYFVLPYYKSYHPYFGYELNYKPAVDHIQPGAIFPKDTLFADTPANKGNHNYTYGANLNMAIMSHPNVGLDGYVIRRGALDKFKFKIYERRTASFGQRSFPLNLYGTVDNYKPFPDIGEYIRPDGLVMAIRDFNPIMTPATLSRKDTMVINHLFDKRIYSRAGEGRVVDVIVTKTNNINKEMPVEMTKMLDAYADSEQRFYNEIIKFEEKLIRESKQAGNDGNISITRDLQRLFVRAKGEVNYPVSINKEGTGPRRPMPLRTLEKGDELDGWHVELVIEYVIGISKGFKFSGKHGGKGVICMIEEDENMPVDKDGNVVDIITGQDSIPGRMNIGRLIEPYFNAAARDVKREIMEKSGLGRYTEKVTREEFLALPKDKMDYFISEYLKFHWIVSPTMAKEYEEYLTEEERVQWLLQYINDKPYIHRMVSNPVMAKDPEGNPIEFNDEKALAIEKNWNLVWDKLTYVTRNGVKEETLENIRVMPIYMMLLDKIADHWLAVDMGKLSIFGLLAPRNEGDKNDTPYKRTPPRTVGETEGALYVLYGGREMIAETLDRSGSLESQLEIARNIFHADKPTNIDRVIDRRKFPLGKYRPIQLVRHMFEVAGMGFEYQKEEL